MKLHIKKRFYLQLVILLILIGFIFFIPKSTTPNHTAVSKGTVKWEFQSIDTMKYSRDLAREKLTDSSFDTVIDQQVKKIAATGATHVAVATPYDSEFYPFLAKWVEAARRYHLNVWFRGNWAGWEGWFDYPKITRSDHIAKTHDFILNNAALFKDGDIFSACPECENGGPGDPRQTGDAAGFQKFIIDEYAMTKQAFLDIHKDVSSNYISMNGDVARLIMDHKTTAKMDGIVTIDHYVASPQKLASDVKQIGSISGGKIVLGEFGAPIPDLNGDMSEEDQAAWIQEALSLLSQNKNVIGVNYWTNMGSSTALWNDDGSEKQAVQTITKAYNPELITITVRDTFGDLIPHVTVKTGENVYTEVSKGVVKFPKNADLQAILVTSPGFKQHIVPLPTRDDVQITLEYQSKDFSYFLSKIRHFSFK